MLKPIDRSALQNYVATPSPYFWHQEPVVLLSALFGPPQPYRFTSALRYQSTCRRDATGRPLTTPPPPPLPPSNRRRELRKHSYLWPEERRHCPARDPLYIEHQPQRDKLTVIDGRERSSSRSGISGAVYNGRTRDAAAVAPVVFHRRFKE